MRSWGLIDLAIVDQNVILAGLHCAVLLFHNRAVDALRADGRPETEVFVAARRATTWHYQWLVLHEFLPLFVGQALVEDILANGRRFYRPRLGQALIPVEFQAACYRFGHSMVRPSYRANLAGDNGGPFFGFIFDHAGTGQADPVDLRGGARAARRFVGWQTFFDFGDGQVKPNKRIDTKLSTPLFDLPLAAIASHDLPTALPQRTLLRHLTWKLPGTSARPRRRPHRRGGAHRASPVRSGVVPRGPARLAADLPEARERFSDGRLPPLRVRRPGKSGAVTG